MHTLTAKSTDSNGVVATSAIVNITVPIPPTIALSTLSNYFIVPAGIDLIAETSAAAGATIAKVEFFSGATLVGTVMTPPYTFRLANTAAGSYSFTAKVTDSQGAFVTSNAVAATVSSGVTLSFAAGLNNATVSDDNISVTGSVQAPPNSGLLINGQLALIGANGTFSANAIPLLAASNTITATLTAQDGETATQTITVNRATVPVTNELVAPGFRVSLDQDEGIIIPGETFAVEVNKENLPGLPVNIVTLSCAAPTAPAGATSFGKSTCTYNTPGTYKVEVIVKDTMDVVIYSKAHIVSVRNAALHIATVRAVQLDLVDRLKAADSTRALNLFFGHARENYADTFTKLGAELATFAAQLGSIGTVNAFSDGAEVILVRGAAGATTFFTVYLMRGEDGIWRIDTM